MTLTLRDKIGPNYQDFVLGFINAANDGRSDNFIGEDVMASMLCAFKDMITIIDDLTTRIEHLEKQLLWP